MLLIIDNPYHSVVMCVDPLANHPTSEIRISYGISVVVGFSFISEKKNLAP